MIHKYIEGLNENTLLLLHGTGGDENDLLEIGKFIDSEANILSVRGNVKEGSINRFFKRLSPGVFDLKDLEFRTIELYNFIKEMSTKYGFDINKVIAIGYSNGANILANKLFTIKNALLGAILLRPMVPRRDLKIVNNDLTNVLILSGINDTICPKQESIELYDYLKDNNKEVELSWINAGHNLTYDDLEISKKWYQEMFIDK